jgi:hypothetical protein
MNKWQERNEKVMKEFHTNGGKVKGDTFYEKALGIQPCDC